MAKSATLSPLECERLLRLNADVRIAELEGAALVKSVQDRVQRARSARAVHLQAIARKYRVDLSAHDYVLDDETRILSIK